MGAPAKDGVPDFDASGLSDEELAGAIMMLGYFEGALVRALQVASAENRRREAARGGDAAQEAPMSPVTAEPASVPGDDLDLALAHGEGLLGDVAVRYPGLGPGGDGGAQPELVAAGDDDDAGVGGVELPGSFVGGPGLFDLLLKRSLQVEEDLAERGAVLGLDRRYDVAATIDDDGHLIRRVCAVIDEDCSTVLVDLETPAVVDRVQLRVERPLCDRVRVACYLVALYSDAVCLLGLGDAVRGKVVGGLGRAVGLLRALVRQARQQQAADADARGDGVHDQGQRVHSDSSPVGGDGAMGGDPAPASNDAWEPTGEDPATAGAALEGVA